MNATPRPEQTFDDIRLNALSDGLFAIVLTLLVLDIRLPEAGGAASALGLLRVVFPPLAGYLMTFVIAGIYWILHVRVVGALRGVDRELLWINLMLLLSVGLLPFSSAALTGDNALGYPFYSVNMVLIGTTQAALWGYAAAAGLLKDAHSDPAHIRLVLGRTLVTPTVFLLVLIALPFAPTVAAYLPFAIIPGQFLIREPRGPRHVPVRPGWARFWRLVALAPVAAFLIALLWLRR